MNRPTAAELKAQLDLIEQIVESYANGITKADLGKQLSKAGHRLEERTIARRLNQLIDEQRVLREGKARKTTYRKSGISSAHQKEEDYVPLTKPGAQVRSLVRRPLSQRPPVGYRNGFLEKYVPGKKWYLSKPQLQQLHEMGRTPEGSRPAGTYAREILDRLLIDLAWASSRLEGNTYTRLDTQNLLEFGQKASGKDAAETQMILNHKTAIELLVEGAEEIGFNRYTLFNLHAALSENLLDDPNDEGRLRTRMVNITSTTYTPLGIPQRIEEYFDSIMNKANTISDPFEQAFFVMVHFPYLQPFADVNKRVSRLAANIPLIKHNLSPLSFVDVPEQAYAEGTLAVYEFNRIELLRDVFMWAYERSSAQYHVIREALGEPDPFRLRYRSQLAEAVRETVLRGGAPSSSALSSWAADHEVPKVDLDKFADAALSLLLGLHEGSIARYRLRPSEFASWRSLFPSKNQR